ncbi:cdc42 homolog [Babylonia areolata]|uniref:cdc42 homolog n=1 Tax=Babylonia areolata TaxID=304850 RepID=UPI003FD6364F
MKFRLQKETQVETTRASNIQLKSYQQKTMEEKEVNGNNVKPTISVVENEGEEVNGNSRGGGGGGGGGRGGGGGERGRGGGEGEGGSGGEKYVHCALLGDGMVGKTCLTLSYTQHLFTDRYTATVFDNYPVPVSVEGDKFVVNLYDTAGQSDYESLRTSSYQVSEVLVLCFSVCDRESFYSVVNCWLPEIQRHTKGRRPLLLVGTQIDLRTSQQASSSSASSTDLGAASSSSSSSPSDSGPSSASTPVSRTSSSSSSDSKTSSSSSSSSSTSSSSTSFSSSTSQEEVSTEEGSQLAKMIGADCYMECSARSEEGVRQVFEHVVFSALKYRKKKGKILSRLFSR